jgi:hypothetical protein
MPIYNYYTNNQPLVSDYHSGWKWAKRVIGVLPESVLIALAPVAVPLLVE